jgi:hypothetical protein
MKISIILYVNTKWMLLPMTSGDSCRGFLWNRESIPTVKLVPRHSNFCWWKTRSYMFLWNSVYYSILSRNECFSQCKMVITWEESCKIWTQYPELNLVPDFQSSIPVGKHMGVTCFYENHYTTAFWSKMIVPPNENCDR